MNLKDLSKLLTCVSQEIIKRKFMSDSHFGLIKINFDNQIAKAYFIHREKKALLFIRQSAENNLVIAYQGWKNLIRFFEI